MRVGIEVTHTRVKILGQVLSEAFMGWMVVAANKALTRDQMYRAAQHWQFQGLASCFAALRANRVQCQVARKVDTLFKYISREDLLVPGENFGHPKVRYRCCL